MRLRKIIAANVEMLRRERSLSQEELAKLLKVNKQTIWRLEKGSTNIGIDTLESLAKALKVEPPALLVDRSKNSHNAAQLQRLDEILDCLDKSVRLARETRDNLLPEE